MSKAAKRIWTTFSRGGEYAGEHRELHAVTRNPYGDFLFALDGGEVWQFTIAGKVEQEPTAENVVHLGIGKDSKTGKPCEIIAFLGVEGPAGQKFYNGNLRVLPREQQVEPAKRGTGKSKPGGKKHELKGKDKGTMTLIIRDVINGNRKAGIEPLEGEAAKKEIMKRAKKSFPGKTLCSDRMLDLWIEDVRMDGHIRGSIMKG